MVNSMGSYQHPDVPKIDNAKCVQNRVWYKPDNDFAAFDIRFVLGEETETGAGAGAGTGTEEYRSLWLSLDEMKTLCTQFEIPTVPEVGRAELLVSC
jgi:hypothetical protein